MNKIIIAVLATALVVTGAFAFFGNKTVVQETRTVGAGGPDLNSTYIIYGSTMRVSGGGSLDASTTLPVICSIKSPVSTSTLVNVQVNMRSGSTTAQTLYIAKGAVGATTTNLASTAVLAKGNANLIGSSTLMTSANTLFAPNTWINIGFEQYGASDTVYGECSAEWVLTRPM